MRITLGRIEALDGLRGWAAMAVVVHHLFISGGGEVIALGHPIGILIMKLALFGRHGVDFFFVLSGFLITSILLESRTDKSYFRTFHVRRMLRILPLCYGCLLVVFVLIPWLTHGASQWVTPLKTQVFFWTFTNNVLCFIDGVAFPIAPAYNLVHFWALAVEEQFYLVWPFLVFLLSPRGIVRTSLLLIVVAVLTRAGMEVVGFHTQIWYFTFARVDALAVGTCLAAVRFENGWSWEAVKRVAPQSLLLLAVLTGGLALVPRSMCVGTIEVLRYLVFALFFGSLVVVCVADQGSGALLKVISNPASRRLGEYSYGIYVYHGLLIPCFGIWFRPESIACRAQSQVAGLVWYMLWATAVSVALAAVSYHLYEKPIVNLKRHFPYGR
ncbi:MAG: hypothetical protein A3K19_16425 [Lentisphaerae bacterium RIFOXYB12_FULL_65_16]|nr:MAG: hypothetical protein A3K18_32855 [Lentisphaerae bacterium RIFOXYA12_64_32]OGV89029.1 MAG: hypothetical protein A3K19_16425 [Lentisphaerae bacterium RIFOXYB12_FULL_65_16]